MTRRLIIHQVFKLDMMRLFLMPFCFLIVFFAPLSIQAQNNSACSQNYALACDEEKRLQDEVKRLQCRLDAVRLDKQTLIACISADQNRVELDKLKGVLLQTLNEVTRIQQQPVKLPVPCVTGNCN